MDKRNVDRRWAFQFSESYELPEREDLFHLVWGQLASWLAYPICLRPRTVRALELHLRAVQAVCISCTPLCLLRRVWP